MEKNDLAGMLDLTGKVAVVTGGGDGIGRGACEILAAAGAKVVVSSLHLDHAEQTVQAITENGGEALATTCNVLDDNDRIALINKAVQAYGTVNILVNNAGMGGGGRENPFKIDLPYVERIFAMNVFAPWRLCQLAVPHMAKSGYGSIINISSMSSQDKEANMGIYASSKAALNHLTANLAHDFGPLGVRVNNVGPGATRTAALASILSDEILEKMLKHTPIRRLGEVEDIAAAILFFASPMSAWISGQTLFVNGGGSQTLD